MTDINSRIIKFKRFLKASSFIKQAVSTRKMIAIKFILFFVICSMSAAMILQQIQGRIQHESKSVGDKEKILAYLRLGRLNRSRSGLLFH